MRLTGNKYRNKPTVCGEGHKHRSKKEANRCNELELMQKAHIIRDLKVEVPYVLIEKTKLERACKYYADFDYYDETGQHIVEDTKGKRTKEYIIKRKLFRTRFPDIKFIET